MGIVEGDRGAGAREDRGRELGRTGGGSSGEQGAREGGKWEQK